MIMVFSHQDKDLLIDKGFRFISEQTLGNQIGFIFDDKNKLNFEQELNGIKFVKTNKLCF